MICVASFVVVLFVASHLTKPVVNTILLAIIVGLLVHCTIGRISAMTKEEHLESDAEAFFQKALDEHDDAKKAILFEACLARVAILQKVNPKNARALHLMGRVGIESGNQGGLRYVQEAARLADPFAQAYLDDRKGKPCAPTDGTVVPGT